MRRQQSVRMTTSSLQAGTARVRGVFQRLGKTGTNPELENIAGILEFDVDRVGSWQVSIKHGAISVSEGAPKAADCILYSDEEEFLRIVSGKDSIVTAMLRGELKFSGNLAVGLAVRRLFPIDS